MDRNPIQSPTELDEGGWRGRVRGVTRISSKAGFTAALVLAALFGMIVYGISTAGHRSMDKFHHSRLQRTRC